MNDYLKNEIMGQSRHQFIYCYDTLEKCLAFKALEDDYPVKVNENSPIAIYMKDFSLPKRDIDSDVDGFRLQQVSREYFNLSLIKNILRRVKENPGILDDEKLNKFLKRLYIVTSDNSSYTSLDEFDSDLRSSLDFYSNFYDSLLAKDNVTFNFNDIKIPFIMPDMVVPGIKNMLVNDSYFGIIIDQNSSFCLNTYKVVNSYVSRRINSDLSFKVVTDPRSWISYYDTNGEFVESTHDYGVVELDDSLREHTKELIRKYMI